MTGRYRGSYGEIGANYSYAKDRNNWNYSAQGSVVASHPYELLRWGNLSRDTFAIVHIDEGADVKRSRIYRYLH